MGYHLCYGFGVPTEFKETDPTPKVYLLRLFGMVPHAPQFEGFRAFEVCSWYFW